VKGAQDQICGSMTEQEELAAWLIYCSSKFVLLHKLLPKLQAGGHRVLIFSQMVSVLNLLADYLRFRHYHFERLDGGIRGHDRQVRAYVRCAMSSSK
jgi:SNF2 family DNA or RNA helicase